MEFSNIFNDKKVIVTGHTGFKGSWLSLWLNILGAKVIGTVFSPETFYARREIFFCNKSFSSAKYLSCDECFSTASIFAIKEIIFSCSALQR